GDSRARLRRAARSRRRLLRTADRGPRTLHECVGKPKDVAGSDRHQQIAIAEPSVDDTPGRVEVAQPPNRPSPRAIGGRARDIEAADAGELADRLLARRVDVEDPDRVGARQGAAEAAGERPRPRVEVRLEDGDEAAWLELAQGLEARLDL